MAKTQFLEPRHNANCPWQINQRIGINETEWFISLKQAC